MAKDSFIIYKSFYEPIKLLSDKQLGRLFRALFDYQIEGSTQVDADLQMAFAFFKNQMDMDESKYQKVVQRNKLNGSKGGRPTREESTQNPLGLKKARKPCNDNDNGNENDSKIEKLSTDNSKQDLSVWEEMFRTFMKAYPGRKEGFSYTFESFRKKNKHWKEILPLLLPALQKEIAWRSTKDPDKEFVPQWKNLSTWLNKRCWEQELGAASASIPDSFSLDPKEGDRNEKGEIWSEQLKTWLK